jgi:hypothetical protein
VAYTDQATLAKDATFRGRVQVAIVTAASQIVGESATGDNEVEDKRQYLGIQVLNDSTSFVDRFTWAVVANPAITQASSDNDIQFSVNAAFSDMAGVRAAD